MDHWRYSEHFSSGWVLSLRRIRSANRRETYSRHTCQFRRPRRTATTRFSRCGSLSVGWLPTLRYYRSLPIGYANPESANEYRQSDDAQVASDIFTGECDVSAIEKLGIEVTEHDFVWEVAARLKELTTS